ncbi:hypothetical protein A2335_02915 [Candidatus Peregrinibacteria bacterium RIFOXYB2_FULL_32_7]|nr:MAG: hypothetical protein A2335_02915 [Candidatus Peregrinibacteria bacterium RIFOXYB2_FULL_32_7]
MKKLFLLFSIFLFVISFSGCASQLNGQGIAEPNDQGAIEPNNTKEENLNIREFVMFVKQWEFNPSEITVNKGDMVRLKITSLDVEHGIAIPDFNVKANLKPGKETIVEFVPDKTGTFTFFCSVYCGEEHKEMKGVLIVQ